LFYVLVLLLLVLGPLPHLVSSFTLLPSGWQPAPSSLSYFLWFTRQDMFLVLPVFLRTSFLLSFTPRSPRRSTLSVLLFYCGSPRCCLVSSVPSDLRLFRYLTAHSTAHYVCFLLLTMDAILRFALVSSSLPLFLYGLRSGVPTTLYIQRLSL